MCGMFITMILRVQHLLFGLLIKILLYKFLSNLLETCLKQNLLLFFKDSQLIFSFVLQENSTLRNCSEFYVFSLV